MVQIYIHKNTKHKLDIAKKYYCKTKELPDSLCMRVSYDTILNTILDEVEFK